MVDGVTVPSLGIPSKSSWSYQTTPVGLFKNFKNLVLVLFLGPSLSLPPTSELSSTWENPGVVDLSTLLPSPKPM